jgi:hypothetical protein
VVEIVRAAVPAPVPVMFTGLVEPKLKVGGLMALAGLDVIAVASETLPVNPPEGVTVMVLVPPLPAATVKLAGKAEIARPGTGAAFTAKLCGTIVAAAYVALPACVASMVQVPGETKVAVVPETVQTLVVVEAKLTANPEEAVATRVSVVPTVWAPGLAKVMVCAIGAAFTVRAIVVDAVRLPDVPVMVTVTGPPVVAVPLAVSVSTLVLVAGLVPQAAVTPDGNPVAARVTPPENP